MPGATEPPAEGPPDFPEARGAVDVGARHLIQALIDIGTIAPHASRVVIKAATIVMCAERPLTLLELRKAAAVETGDTGQQQQTNPEDPSSFLNMCRGVLELERRRSASRDDQNMVRFVDDTMRAAFANYILLLNPSPQLEMTNICMTYLASTPPHDASSSSGEPGIPHRPPFYRYAATYWGHHARRSGQPPASWAVDPVGLLTTPSPSRLFTVERALVDELDPLLRPAWHNSTTNDNNKRPHSPSPSPSPSLASELPSHEAALAHTLTHFGLVDALAGRLTVGNPPTPLLEAGVDLADTYGKTPLERAADNHLLLLKATTTPSSSSSSSPSPSSPSSSSSSPSSPYPDYLAVLCSLLSHGCDPNPLFGPSAVLLRAALQGDAAVASALVTQGRARIDERALGYDAIPVVSRAVRAGVDAGCVRALLEAGATDLTPLDSQGLDHSASGGGLHSVASCTPLYEAVVAERPDVARVLLEFGADVEGGRGTRYRGAQTPLSELMKVFRYRMETVTRKEFDRLCQKEGEGAESEEESVTRDDDEEGWVGQNGAPLEMKRMHKCRVRWGSKNWCSANAIRTLRVLLSYGANPTAAFYGDNTPLKMAEDWGGNTTWTKDVYRAAQGKIVYHEDDNMGIECAHETKKGLVSGGLLQRSLQGQCGGWAGLTRGFFSFLITIFCPAAFFIIASPESSFIALYPGTFAGD